MRLLRLLLLPVVPIYYLATWIRNILYDFNIFKSTSYGFPVICVGNLSVGGTGKTPMIENLIRLLKDDYKLATLSRGYKRSTDGFILADENATANSIGDEPFQFHTKFNNILVSVDADRRNGIDQLSSLPNKPEIILLDDAFQHRKVKAKLNILLTPLNDIYIDDFLLPTGDLREPISGAKRADIIVVTKCVQRLTISQKNDIVKSLKIKKHQMVFFSSTIYSETIKNDVDHKALLSLKGKAFTLVTGIAHAQPLVDYLKLKGMEFEHLNFKDHHEFNEKDIENLKSRELILTTEKDYMRLKPYFKGSDKIFYLPIESRIHNTIAFNRRILDALK